MHTLADAITAAAWREVIPDPLARAKRQRIRVLMREPCIRANIGSADKRMSILHHIAQLEHEIYGGR